MTAVLELEAQPLMVREGLGGVPDPDDPGGETVWGCSRKNWPNEPIWKLVDAKKALPDYPRNMAGDQAIRQAAIDFMKLRFWDPLRCGEMPSQAIAAELFDTGYNMGTGPAALFLIKSLNALNKDGKLYADLPFDVEHPVVDRAVIDAVTTVCARPDGEFVLWIAMNATQTFKYLQLKEKYIWGWILNRTFDPALMKRLFPARFRA